MKKQKKQRKGNNGGISVVASNSLEVKSTNVLRGYSCNECNTNFTVSSTKGIEPFCVHCASTKLTGTKKTFDDISKTEESSLAAVICKSEDCKATNIISDNTALSLAGLMNCVVCGETLNYDFSAITAGDEYDDFDADEDGNTEREEDVNSDEEASLDLDITTLAMVSKPSDINFLRTDNAILAFADTICVASLVETNDNTEMFKEPAYIRAMYATLKNSDLDKVIADYKFDRAMLKVSKDNLIKSVIEKATARTENKVKNDLKDYRKILAQCLGIAASGLNKGFFSDKEHCIKSSLYDELVASGHKNPISLVDKVFARTSDAHHKVLLDLAFDLMSKPTDVRNALADAIGETNYTIAADEVDESKDEITSRLEKPFKPSNSELTTASIHEIRDNVGRGRLFQSRG